MSRSMGSNRGDSVEGPRSPTPVYSPWTEDPDALAARHVGGDKLVERITRDAVRHEHGDRPLPIYLFGPRGIGKSHVVALAASRVRIALRNSSIPVRVIGEDIPEPRDADDLWLRLVPPDDVPPWASWAVLDQAAQVRPTVLFVEGWDRLLHALGAAGRKRLRGHLLAHPEVWLVGTGARLTDALTSKEEAFYAAFDAIPLQAIGPGDADALVDHHAGAEALSHPRWPARREALITLAGGNPRALIALADAVAAAPGEEVARRLLTVLDAFTPHYQLRFRDCSGQEQRLVDLLSRAPRELGPTDISHILGEQSSTWSTAAHRLEEQGILSIRREGRQAWYRITEPLFRHWLEFRAAPSDQSRVGWLGRLLERVLGPDELVAAWTLGGDETVRSAALDAVGRRPEARDAAWARVTLALDGALEREDAAEADAAVTSAVALRPDAERAWTLVLRLTGTPVAAMGARFASALRQARCPTLALLATGLAREVEARDALRGLARAGRAELERAGALSPALALASTRGLQVLMDRGIAWKDRRGGVWKITDDEAMALAGLPGLRYRFSRHGRLPSHPPLVESVHLMRVSMGPEDPDLDLLLWAALADRVPELSGRILALLDQAAHPRLPACPWPGRRLSLNPDTLCRVAARSGGREALLWVGALGTSSDAAFEELTAALGRSGPPAPPRGRTLSFELSLSRLRLDAPERFLALAGCLSADWQPILSRAELLVAQLAESKRGPLHPELERVRLVLAATTPM